MSVDVEIYLNNIIKFFRENPKDLLNLIPKEFEESFYKKIKDKATENIKDGLDAALTQKQLLEICVSINTEFSIRVDTESKYFQNTKHGKICLN